jgi:RND family efflux transporter MFP subunit
MPLRSHVGNAVVFSALLMSSFGAFAAGESVEATAFTVPFRMVELATDAGGVLQKVYCEEGDVVKEGQLLVELRSDMVKAERAVTLSRLESARVQVTASEITHAQRKMDLDRVAALAEKKIVSQEDHDKARLEMELSRLAIDNAKAQVKMIEVAVQRDDEAVRRTQVRAPHEGTVVRIYKREGEAVQERTPVASISCLDPLYVIANLPIATAGKIVPGAKGRLTLENMPGQTLACEVTVVDNVVDPASGMYRVKLTLPNPDRRIAAGAKGTLALSLGR